VVDATLGRLGAVYPAHGVPEELAAYAAGVEALGLGQLWLVEDCFLTSGMILAATALAVTRRLGVGVGLLPVPLRNPALAAMEIATLARAHPGRVTIAFGHGVRSWMQQVDALPANRLVALEESVAAIRALLAGAPVSGAGAYVRLREVELELPPESPPDVLVGTTGPRGLDIAERTSDGVLLPEGCGPDCVRWALNGRPSLRRCVVYAWLAVADDREAAIARLSPAVSDWAVSEHYAFPREAVGLQGAPAALQDGTLADLTRRVGVAGDAAACAETISELFASGATDVILAPQGPGALEQLDRVVAGVTSRLAPAAS
jgi:5,10-methylenetetrahydromethanopterin reductase